MSKTIQRTDSAFNRRFIVVGITLFWIVLVLIATSITSAQKEEKSVVQDNSQFAQKSRDVNESEKVRPMSEEARQAALSAPLAPSQDTAIVVQGVIDSRSPNLPTGPPFDVLTNDNLGATGTSHFTQSEASIVAFGNTVVIGFNDSGSNAGGLNHFTGFSRSIDGGATFTDGGTLPSSTGGDGGVPVLARHEVTGRIFFATDGFPAENIQVFRSDDNGLTWSAPVNATPGGSGEDKSWMTVDNSAGAGNGNVYVVSRRHGVSPGIYFFRSTDTGLTFSPTRGTLIVSASAVANVNGAFVTVGPDHSVYVFWYDEPTSSLRVRKSSDLGLTFSPPVTVASGLIGGINGDLGLTGIRQGTATPAGFRSNQFPHATVNPISGHLYVTYNNDVPGADKADVFMTQSTDGGATWSPAIRVNDDATTTDQWMPTIVVSGDGNDLGIFYYSRQEDPGNNLFKYYGRLGRISDTAITFAPSFPVSDVASLPEFGRDSVINSVYMGDYNVAVSTPGVFHVAWADNRDDLPGGDGRKDPNVFYQSIPLTSFTASCTENFDGVTAPALPAGWTATTAIDCANSNPWATSSSDKLGFGPPDTAPNAAFVNAPGCISDERLDSPSFPIVSPSAQLTFNIRFDMENGFDGGFLEIKIGGGEFQDIVAAGGSNPYNGTVGGRPAWTGTGAGRITVNLPAAANGQDIVLRWRRTTDSSVDGRGWSIDTITLSGADCGGDACQITCPANITQSNDPNQCGAVVNYPAPTVTGNCGTVTCSPASGSFFPTGTTTVTCTTMAGPSCSFTVTVNQDTPGMPTIEAGPAILTTESCPPDNNQIDPGERVTVNLELHNISSCPTNNLVATLVPGGGVSSPSSPQSYGALTPTGPGSSATRDFSFTASGVCGGSITATWNLNDGPNNLGTVTKTFTLGCTTPCGVVRLVTTSMLSRVNATTVKATYTVKNIGTVIANDVTLTNSRLGTTTGGPLPQFIDDLPPDIESPPFEQFFTNSTPGVGTTLKLDGTYAGGTFTSTKRVTIP